MKVTELSREQIAILKRRYVLLENLENKETITAKAIKLTLTLMHKADELVSDEAVMAKYADKEFTPEDFFQGRQTTKRHRP